jgi:arylsulfatase A-like enzyme
MQGSSLLATESRGLPPGKILPEYLRDLGYVTRAVGKWHLGFYKKEVTPTYRGFDSHLGYWNDYVSYYDYILQERVNMQNNFTQTDLSKRSSNAGGRHNIKIDISSFERVEGFKCIIFLHNYGIVIYAY